MAKYTSPSKSPDDEKLELLRPLVIGVVITKGNDKINLCPVNWQVVSTAWEKPFVVCICLSKSNYDLESILKYKEFVYAYPSRSQLKDILYCGTVSGRTEDKIAKTKLQFTNSESVTPPNLVGAVANFECRLHTTVEMDTFVIVLGKVVKIKDSSLTALDKIYALGEYNYGAIKDVEILQHGRT